MKKFLTMLAAAALLAAGIAPLRAAEPKPIAALAVASYSDLISDTNYAGALVDKPQLGGMADGVIAFFTQGKGLAGVDKSRPWGAIVEASSEEDVAAFVCVPVTDFKAALELLKLFNTVDADGDVYKLTPRDGKKISFMKQHGKWACISDKAASLAHITSDPLAVLGSLEKNYIVSGRIFLANVPEALRDKVMGPIKKGIEKEANHKKHDESDEEYAQRKKFIEETESYLVRVAGDLDQIDLGWGLDREAEKTYVDLSVTAKEGTKTAAEMELVAAAKTYFAGFRIPGAASLWAVASPIPEAKQQIAASLIDVIRGKVMAEIEKKTPEDKREIAKELAGEGLDLLTDVVKSGRVDAVGAGLIGPKSATGLAAFYVADGSLFDKMLHTVVKAIETDHPEVAQYIKLDAVTVGDLKIHKASLPIPQDAENRDTVVKYIGESLDIVVAVGKENVYIGAGRDAAEKLKKAVMDSKESGATSVAPVEASYAMQPIVGAIAIAGKPHDRPVAKMAETELKKTPGKDHITLTVKPIANGAKVQLGIEAGVMRTAGKMVMLKSGHGRDDDKTEE